MKLTFEIKSEDKNCQSAVKIDLNNICISKQEDNIFSLMRKASLEQTMVENTIKESRTKKDSFVDKEVSKSMTNDSASKSLVSKESSKSPEKKTASRRTFKEGEKKNILDTYTKHGKTYTMIKYNIKEGTLNSFITRYNKKGDEAFCDQRISNTRPSIQETDATLVNYIKDRRKLFLPVPLFSVRAKALEIYNGDKEFKASNSWLKNFLKRNGFSLRKKTKKLKKSTKPT